MRVGMAAWGLSRQCQGVSTVGCAACIHEQSAKRTFQPSGFLCSGHPDLTSTSCSTSLAMGAGDDDEAAAAAAAVDAPDSEEADRPLAAAAAAGTRRRPIVGGVSGVEEE